MASCEKCWRDARGDPELYRQIIAERTGTEDQCTPEEQAGGQYAELCETCGRNTIHCVLKRCVNPLCDNEEFD